MYRPKRTSTYKVVANLFLFETCTSYNISILNLLKLLIVYSYQANPFYTKLKDKHSFLIKLDLDSKFRFTIIILTGLPF